MIAESFYLFCNLTFLCPQMFPVYMKMYNLLGCCVCVLALVYAVLHAKLQLHSYVLKICFCQTFFLLEIFNIKIGKSNSTLFPTILQLSSRLFIIWIVCYAHREICRSIPFTIMLVCWYVSDLIRYIYYLLRVEWAKWMRYNFFIVFYPVGTAMEFYLTNSIYLKYGMVFSYLIGFIILCYVPGFCFLYYHMIKQRTAGNKKRKIIKKKD